MDNANKKKISDFIAQNADLDEIDYDLAIFEVGLVNSLFAIDLMTFLERNFDIKIKLVDLDMENFKSINNIICFIESKGAVQDA